MIAPTDADLRLRGIDLTQNEVWGYPQQRLLPPYPGVATQYLDGTGRFSTPAGGASTAQASRLALYQPFTVGANDDEFDDGSFSGWTAVNSGSHNPTITEANDVVSMSHPGGDAAAETHGYVKTVTINTGNYVECWVRGNGLRQSFNVFGCVMADGTTYNGSNTQVFWWLSPSQTLYNMEGHTKWNTAGTSSTFTNDLYPYVGVGLRLVYKAANTFTGWVSPDGVSWINITGDVARTLTPTVAGFFISTWGGAQPYVFTFHYVRFG